MSDLVSAVQGDFEAFSSLLLQQHDTLAECRQALDELVLTAADMRAVLLALRNNKVSPGLLQNWASFVWRGYIADDVGESQESIRPIKPIEIAWKPAFEDQIAEVISRLE